MAAARIEAQPALLHDYVRFLVKGQSYPGIVEQSGQAVEGVLYCDVDEDALAHLDLFEGDLYERRTVRVATAGGDKTAFVYVVPAAQKSFLSTQPWDKEQFRQRDFDRFLAAVRDGSFRVEG